MTQIPQGNNMFWSVQTAVAVGSASAQTEVTKFNLVTLHLDDEIYINFGASDTAANSTANDIKLGPGLHSLTVPKQVGNEQYLNYLRVGAINVTMRLVLS